MLKSLLSLFLLSVCLECILAATVIDCQRPPQLVDPAQCCLDGGRDEVTETCAQRMGITGHANEPAPSIDKATCLAECILTESKYMQTPETLNLQNIKNDLQTKFSNDSLYAETMLQAFTKCQPNAQRKMQAFKNIPQGNNALQKGCSPFAGMLLGCTYMEYFKNCPTHRWTVSPKCLLAKQFVIQCSLGA